MTFGITGTLIKVFDTEIKSDKFKTRDFVIQTLDERWPQVVKFQLTQDKVHLIDACIPGEEVAVTFGLVGRVWNDKYFTNLNAFKVERVVQFADTTKPIEQPKAVKPVHEPSLFDDETPF